MDLAQLGACSREEIAKDSLSGGGLKNFSFPPKFFSRSGFWVRFIAALNLGSAIAALSLGSAVAALSLGSAVAALSLGSAVAALSLGSAVAVLSLGYPTN